MAITLSPEVERRIEGLVSRGFCQSAEHFVTESLRRAEERERWLADLQASLEEGVKDIAQGRGVKYDREGSRALVEQIKREGRVAMGLSGDAP